MKNLKTTKDQAIKTAFGYTRTATKKNASEGNSLDEQSKRIKEYCQKKDIKLVKIYSDSAKSGVELSRPALNRLLIKVKKTPVNYLVITDLSRLSRDTFQYLTLKSLLKKFGIEVLTVNTPRYKIVDPYSDFFDQILAAMNALYPRVMAARRSRRKYGRKNA